MQQSFDRAAEPSTSAGRHVLLDPGAQAARTARELVAELLESEELEDLVDVATLLVSEVVTNAVLHAATPVELHCEVDDGRLRVHVRDGSSVLPSVRHYDDDALTGRGLGLVELLAAAWGAVGTESGKTVWFELAGAAAEEAPATSERDVPATRHEPTVEVRFRSLPASLVLTTIQYGDSLLRELALMTLSAGSALEIPAGHAVHLDLAPVLEAAEEARRAGVDEVDVAIRMPVSAAAAAYQRLSLLDEADRLARDRAILSRPALPEIAACRRWLLGQIALQAEGGPPTPWTLPAAGPAMRGPARLSTAAVEELDGRSSGAVVADEANQIIYANAAAADLLGWDVDELVGQRLVAIVPPDLREAHLAGFGRYLITGEPRLLGRRVVLPALRRDGSRIDVDLVIEAIDVADEGRAFVGTFRTRGAA